MYGGYDQEWSLPYTDNFTGPYWSDGQFQKSVAYSKKKPKTLLDSYSKEHDMWSALCESDQCLNAADELYELQTSNMSFFPRMIGKMPKAFNKPARMVSRLVGGERMSKVSGMPYLPPPRPPPGEETNLIGSVVGGLYNLGPKSNLRPTQPQLYQPERLEPQAVYTPQGDVTTVSAEKPFVKEPNGNIQNLTIEDSSQQWLGGNPVGLTRRNFSMATKSKKKKSRSRQYINTFNA